MDDGGIVQISDNISYDKNHTLKTEVYYVTKISAIHGYLYLHDTFLRFEPIISEEE